MMECSLDGNDWTKDSVSRNLRDVCICNKKGMIRKLFLGSFGLLVYWVSNDEGHVVPLIVFCMLPDDVYLSFSLERESS